MNPAWVEISPEEVIDTIDKNAKRGVGASNIGRMLRDQYGIPSIRLLAGKKLGKIMDEKKISPEIPEDLSSLIKRAAMLRTHVATHKNDKRSKRGLQLMDAKIIRLTKYYKRADKLPENWQYTQGQAKIMAQ